MDHLLFTSSNIVQFKIIECYHLLFVWQFVKRGSQCFLSKHLKTIINICILARGVKRERSTFILNSCPCSYLSHVSGIANVVITFLLEKTLSSRGELAIWPSATIRHFLASILLQYIYSHLGAWNPAPDMLNQKSNQSRLSMFLVGKANSFYLKRQILVIACVCIECTVQNLKSPFKFIRKEC